MMKVCRKTVALALVAALGLWLTPQGQAALIPHDLDVAAQTANVVDVKAAQSAYAAAGVPAPQAQVRAASLDRVEMARLEKADLSQKGGDGLVIALAIIGAAAVIVWILRGLD